MASYRRRYLWADIYTDDRGVSYAAWPLYIDDPAHLQNALAARRRIDRGQCDVNFRCHLYLVLGIMGYGVLTLFFALLESPTEPNSTSVQLSVWALVIAIMFSVRWQKYADARRAGKELQATPSYCPVCAHNLSDLLPDADGCTVCPTCKAAWDMSRSQRPEA